MAVLRRELGDSLLSTPAAPPLLLCAPPLLPLLLLCASFAPLLCCLSSAVPPLLSLLCCLSSAASPLLSLLCCLSSAAPAGSPRRALSPLFPPTILQPAQRLYHTIHRLAFSNADMTIHRPVMIHPRRQQQQTPACTKLRQPLRRMKTFLETIVLHPYHREAPAHCLVHDSLLTPCNACRHQHSPFLSRLQASLLLSWQQRSIFPMAHQFTCMVT